MLNDDLSNIAQTLLVIYLVGLVPSWVWLCGTTFAYFQRKYPSIAREGVRGDRRHALLNSILGALSWPMTLPIDYLNGYWEYGWKWPSLNEAKERSRER